MIEKVVARDGVEPPTPAFSGPELTVINDNFVARVALEVVDSPWGKRQLRVKSAGQRQRNNSLVFYRGGIAWPAWAGALSCGTQLMNFFGMFGVLILKARRRIAGDRLAMAKPGSIE